MEALPGEKRVLFSVKKDIASGLHGILAPSTTAIHLFLTSNLASSFFNSFWVAQGNAKSTLTSHGDLDSWKDALGYFLIYSEILPLSIFFRFIIQDNFSVSIPSESWIYPFESLIVTTLAPSCIHFSQANCATLPEPEIDTILFFKLSSFVLSIFSAK